MYQLLLISTGATVDIFALVFLFGFALRGLFKGFAKSFVSLFGTIISLLLAILLCSTVARFLENEFSLVSTISDSLTSTLNKLFGESVMNTTLEQATEESLGNAGVGSWLIAIVLSFKDEINIPSDVTLSQLLCPTFSYYLVIVIAIIILFVLFKILLFLIGEIVKKMYTISLVRHVDRILGFALGLFSGIIYIELIITTMSVVPIKFIQDAYAFITSSGIVNFINKLNLFNVIMNAVSINTVVEFVKSLFTV